MNDTKKTDHGFDANENCEKIACWPVDQQRRYAIIHMWMDEIAKSIDESGALIRKLKP